MANPLIENFFSSLFDSDGHKSVEKKEKTQYVSEAFSGSAKEIEINSNHATYRYYKSLVEDSGKKNIKKKKHSRFL